MKNGARTALVLLVFLIGPAFQATPVLAEPVYTSFLGKAINGYDPVAYFSEGQPRQGKSTFQSRWQGADWYFVSAENKQIFDQNPEKYAPQYGGFCAWAVSRGYTASTDPEAWDIVDGKLYLNYSLGVQSDWRKARASNIVKADKNWPALRAD